MPKKTPPLTMHAYWHVVGTQNVEHVAWRSGTTMPYIRHLAFRRKRPSYDLARKIIESAQAVTPGFAPDLNVLMLPLDEGDHPIGSPGGGMIRPSRRYTRAAAA